MKYLRCSRALFFLLFTTMPYLLDASSYTCETFSEDSLISGNSSSLAYPTGVNDSGYTVGTYQKCANGVCVDHGFIRSSSGAITEVIFPNAGGTSVRGINNSGQLSGYYTDAAGMKHGFIRQSNGAFTTVDATAEFAGDPLELLAINNNGDALGVIYDSDGNPVASLVRTASGIVSTFPWPGGGLNAPFAIGGINNSDDFVLLGNPRIHHPDGSITMPAYPAGPVPQQAAIAFGFYGINDADAISGTAFYPDTDSTPSPNAAFVRTPDGSYPAVYCPGALPATEQVQPNWLPLSISGTGILAGRFDMVLENGSTTHMVYIARPVASEPALMLSTSSVNFPPTAFATSTSKTVTLTNTGTVPLQIGAIVGANFRLFSASLGTCERNIAPGRSCDLNVTFGLFYAPFDGPVSGQVIISDSTPESPHFLKLAGIVVTPRLNPSATSWTFSPRDVGQSSGPGRVWIYNPTQLALKLTNPVIDGRNASDFVLDSNTCGSALSPYTTCYLRFHFSPTASGLRQADLRLAADLPEPEEAVVQVSLSGLGLGRTLNFSNTSWTFSAHPVGAPSGLGTIYIYNAGSDSVTFAPFSIGGNNPADFRIVGGSCATSLRPYTTCNIQFTFIPTARGVRTARLNVVNDASGSPQFVDLFGTGW